MSLIDEHQLSREEQQLVERWWQDCYDDIIKEGYRLDEYIPSASTRWRPAPQGGSISRRSFDVIVNSGLIIVSIDSIPFGLY